MKKESIAIVRGEIIEVGNIDYPDAGGRRGFVLYCSGRRITVTGLTVTEMMAVSQMIKREVSLKIEV